MGWLYHIVTELNISKKGDYRELLREAKKLPSRTRPKKG